jgi:hypothetical protein
LAAPPASMNAMKSATWIAWTMRHFSRDRGDMAITSASGDAGAPQWFRPRRPSTKRHRETARSPLLAQSGHSRANPPMSTFGGKTVTRAHRRVAFRGPPSSHSTFWTR